MWFAVILPVTLALASSVIGEEVNMKCKRTDLKLPPGMEEIALECGKPSGIKALTDINVKNVGCIVKCAMEKLEMIINEKIVKENILKITVTMPEDIQAIWRVEAMACVDAKGPKLKFRNDSTCSSFMGLLLCVAQKFQKVC